MVERIFQRISRIYKRHLERKINIEIWDPRLSAKLDALEILLSEDQDSD